MCVLYYVMPRGVMLSHVFMFELRLCITNDTVCHVICFFLPVSVVFSPVWLCHSVLATLT